MKKNQDIAIAIVGFGRWGKNHYRALTQLLDKNNLVICDPLTDEKTRIDFPCGGIYHDIDEALRLKKIDLAFVATPSITHYPVAADLLTKGIDVFVEKPMATTAADARRLVKLARQKKKLLIPGHLFLFNRAYAGIKHELGQYREPPANISCIRYNNGPAILDEGVLFDLAIHDIYTAIDLVGEPPRQVQMFSPNPKSGPLMSAVIVLQFRRTVATIQVAWDYFKSFRKWFVRHPECDIVWQDSPPQYLKIFNKKKDSWRSFRNKQVNIRQLDSQKDIVDNLDENTLVNEDWAVLESVRARQDRSRRSRVPSRRPAVAAADGLLAVAIIEKLMRNRKPL